MADSRTTPPPATTFEAAISQLEKIVAEMDDDSLPLEQLIVRYTEGARLVKVCEERLAAVEKKIELITTNAAGEPCLEPLDPAAPAAPKGKARKEDVSLF